MTVYQQRQGVLGPLKTPWGREYMSLTRNFSPKSILPSKFFFVMLRERYG